MCKEFSRKPYADEDLISTYEFTYKGQRVTPGDLIRVKESSFEYRFSSLQTAPVAGVTWIDLRELPSFKIRSFSIGQIAGLIRKKSYNEQ